jgi:hypothetical protein
VKRVYDVGPLVAAAKITELARLRKFNRYWTTTTVNGREVLIARHNLKHMSNQTEKLLNFLHALDSVKKQDFSKVEEAWIFLDRNKAVVPGRAKKFDKAALVKNLNRVFDSQLRYTLTIGPSVQSDEYGTTYIDPVMTIDTYVDRDNYMVNMDALLKAQLPGFMNGGNIVSSTAMEGSYLSFLEIYAPLSDDLKARVKKVSKVRKLIKVPVYTTSYDVITDKTTTHVTYTLSAHDVYELDITVDKVIITETTDLVASIPATVDDFSSPVGTLKGVKLPFLYSSYKTQLSASGAVLSDFKDPYIADDIAGFWVSDESNTGLFSINTYYLAADFIKFEGLTRAERFSYIGSAINSGYEEKSKNPLERLAGVIIVIVAIIFSPFTGGGSLLLLAALTVLYVSVVLAISTAAFKAMGMDGAAASTAEMNKTIAPLVQIAQIVVIMYGVSDIYEKGLEALSSEASTNLVELGTPSFTEIMMKGIEVQVDNFLASVSTNISMDRVVNLVSMISDLYISNDMRDLEKELENEKARAARIPETEEKSKAMDMMGLVSRAMLQPLNAQQSVYSEKYDMPYEWWNSPYHTGNICNTTVSALWESE